MILMALAAIIHHGAHHAVAAHGIAASIPGPCPASRGRACNDWGSEHTYWRHLFNGYLTSIRQPNVSFEWYTELQEWAWVVVVAGAYLIGTVFTYRHQNKRGRSTDPAGPRLQDLYPVESYNGYITERNGGVDNFNWAVIIVVTLYTALIIGSNLVHGQVY